MKKDLPANVHYLKSAPVKPCACAECSQISHLQVFSSLLDPYTLCKQLIPVLRHLEDEEFQDKLNLLLTFKCMKAKYILSQHLITFSISMCLNDKLLHFKDEKTWIFPFYCEESHFYVQILKNQIVIKSTNPVQFKPHEIKQFYFNFTSSMKNLPQLEINEELPILICPDILHSSQNTISKIFLFNTLDSNQILPADTKLMHFSYGA